MGVQLSTNEIQLLEQDYCGEYGTDGSQKECKVYRHNDAITAGHLIDREFTEVHTIYQLFLRKAQAQPDADCLGTKVQNEKTSQYSYRWKSYKDVNDDVNAVATLIKQKNLSELVEDTDFKRKLKVIGICSVNREEWLVTDLACNLLKVTSVPLYETLGNEMMDIILKETQISTLFGSDICLSNILKINNGKQHGIKHIVLFDQISKELQDLANEMGIEHINYHESIQKIKSQNFEHIKNIESDLESVFTISYTSGTSGNSKGVMLSNKNFLSAITNILRMASQFKFNQNDIYISYLPLAHVFDRLGCHTMLGQGGAIGFFGGKILQITEDLQILKPTIFPSVPRLLNKVFDRVMAGIQEKSVFKRLMFFQGLNSKQYYNQNCGWVNNTIFDTLVFSQAKERLGGRVRIMITASAPIAPNVLAFLRCVFCCPIVEAYGQTESCGASFATKVFDTQSGHVGGPGVGVEYKLDDLPEMNYTRETKPYPSGEICIRGPAIFQGYFKNKKLTDETIDKDGWLRTGDVGQLIDQKKLKIVDRVKNIFKLSQGEYIVPEKLERAYEQSELIQQIFIHGDSLKSHIVAIIYPDPNQIKKFVQKYCEFQKDDFQLQDHIQNPLIFKQIEQELSVIAKNNNFNSLEKVKGNFELVAKEFEVGEVLTPTLKLQRKKAREFYQDLIQKIYQRSDAEINKY